MLTLPTLLVCRYFSRHYTVMSRSTGSEELQKELGKLLTQQAELAKASGSTLAGPVAASQRRMVAGTKAAISAAQAPGYMSYRRVSECVLLTTATAIRCAFTLGCQGHLRVLQRCLARPRGGQAVALPLGSHSMPPPAPPNVARPAGATLNMCFNAATADPQGRQSTGS